MTFFQQEVFIRSFINNFSLRIFGRLSFKETKDNKDSIRVSKLQKLDLISE